MGITTTMLYFLVFYLFSHQFLGYIRIYDNKVWKWPIKNKRYLFKHERLSIFYLYLLYNFFIDVCIIIPVPFIINITDGPLSRHCSMSVPVLSLKFIKKKKRLKFSIQQMDVPTTHKGWTNQLYLIIIVLSKHKHLVNKKKNN